MLTSKPYTREIEEFRVSGEIEDFKKKEWFSFKIQLKTRELKKGVEQLKSKIQKVESKEYNYFQTPSFKTLHIRAVYLNKESAEGLYKDKENNLPYEIRSIGDELLYRQSIVERKKDIFNRLEKLAVEEGLRK